MSAISTSTPTIDKASDMIPAIANLLELIRICSFSRLRKFSRW